MAAGVLLGVGCGVVAGAVDWVRFGRRDERAEAGEPWWQTAAVVALYWATFSALLIALRIGAWRAPFGVVWALFFALRARGQSARTDVRPVLGLGWSWRWALRGAGWGLLAAIALGAVAVGVGTERSYFYLALYAVLGAAFGGVTRTVGSSPVPGRGIPLTIRAALRGGLLTGSVSCGLIVITVVVAVVVVWATTGVHPLARAGTTVTAVALWAFTALAAVVFGGLVGLYFGLLGALWFGGADALQHLVLRVLLRRADVPWRLVRFLDHCARLIFLQRVGGGYRFVHGALMAHFAARPGAADERR
jgi:hypothetical protein